MGVFGRKQSFRNKDDQTHYMTVTSDNTTPVMKQKNKKAWKGFLGFQARKKKTKKVDSPRTVLLDVNCMEQNGDTSYEISFLSDDTNGQNMTPRKLNRSTSFGSLINLRRTKSKLSKLNSSKSFDTNEKKSDLFDDYYKNERYELGKKTFPKDPKFPIVSLRNKSSSTSSKRTNLGYDADAFDDIDLRVLNDTKEKQASERNEINTEEEDFFVNHRNEEDLTNLTTDTSEVFDNINLSDFTIDETENEPPTISNDKTNIEENIEEEPIEETKMETKKVDNENIQVVSTNQTNENLPNEESNSFFSRMACEPLNEIFACATSLSKFESMLFGDDLLPSCGSGCRRGSIDNTNNDRAVNYANTSPDIYDPNVPNNKPHNLDNPYELVDTFLNVSFFFRHVLCPP